MRWFDADPYRLNLELDAIERMDPRAMFEVVDDRVVINTIVTAEGPDGAQFTAGLRLTCPWSYPAAPPLARLPGLDIPAERYGSHDWHLYKKGAVCFCERKEWSAQSYLAEVIQKVGVWLANYLAMDAGVIDEMPPTGRWTAQVLSKQKK
jgi:hypothetical protein